MRFLAVHVDYFRSTITEKGRSKIIEPFEERTARVDEALVLLVSVEKADEVAPERVADRAAAEIMNLVGNLKVDTVVLHSFAHLFAELSAPATAVQVLQLLETRLQDRRIQVIRTPFGWFNTLELKAKGHPLSRVARIIRAD